MIKKNINIDAHDYLVTYKKALQVSSHNVPALCLVSYLPNQNATDLIRLAIESIRRFTDSPYSLWVVDNNSPKEYKTWLNSQADIHFIEIHNQLKNETSGSYANALALEVCLQFLPDETPYFMSLHQDILVCKTGWLQYLMSKFSDNIKAVGVREDKARVKEGILHVLGYIIDLKKFKQLNLSYFPELPHFDVGDKAIVGLRNAGFDYFACRNTMWNNLSENSLDISYQCIGFDRAINDNNDVIFMHLGRGSLKSDKNFVQDERKSFNLWKQFAINQLQLPERASIPQYPTTKYHITTFRRYHVDAFQMGAYWHGKVLDVGGKKENKHGLFRPPQGLDWKYLNINAQTNPDYLGSAEDIPVADATFDIVLLTEVLEHLENPEQVLAECVRVLKRGGKIYLLCPFLYPVHAVPYDFQRWTPEKFASSFTKVGLRLTTATCMGGIASVIYDLLRIFCTNPKEEDNYRVKSFLLKYILPLANKYIQNREKNIWMSNNTTITTGYYIEGIKI